MLYLAEVQKQKGGLLGGGAKTELKLLGSQKNDSVGWSQVPEEVIAAEEASKLNDGALVLVELNPSRQVQRIQEAGRPLVNILQNFSRQVEKFKVKEEEIDQWKESLTFQAQELNRREMEMEERMLQLQQLEEECQQLGAQKQEVEASRAEFERLQEETERNRQELEGAWEHLRGEQRRLEEYQAQYQQGATLDEEQSRVLNELLNQLSCTGVQDNLNQAFEIIANQQATLNPYWEELEHSKATVEQQQAEVEQLLQTFSDNQKQWHEIQDSLDQQAAELIVNTATLNSKEEYARNLKQQLQLQETLYQHIHSVAGKSGNVLNQQINLEALENMSIEELQKTVQDMQEKLNIDSSFVQDQELELNYKQQTIEELQQKLSQVQGSDRADLETELADEQDLFQMLNESLVGQRRSLIERQENLRQHQVILSRRQGQTPVNIQDENQIDLRPVLAQLEAQRQQQQEELQNLEREIGQMRNGIELTQGMVDNQTHEQKQKRQELKDMEENLHQMQIALAESWVRVNLYQEALQPIQDGVNGLQHNLQTLADGVQHTGEITNQMRQMLEQLV